MDGLAAAVKNLLKKNGVAESNYSKELLNGLNSIFTLESIIKLPDGASGVILSGSEKEDWVFAPGILTLTEHGYSSYRGIYDSF
jgi:hypothetical protein